MDYGFYMPTPQVIGFFTAGWNILPDMLATANFKFLYKHFLDIVHEKWENKLVIRENKLSLLNLYAQWNYAYHLMSIDLINIMVIRIPVTAALQIFADQKLSLEQHDAEMSKFFLGTPLL